MSLLIAFIFAKIGSKRVIGGFTSFMLCLFIFPVGITLTLQSRRLDDQEADALLLEQFKSK